MHFKAENLRIPKHPQLLFLVQNLRVLQPSKQGVIFCGTPCSKLIEVGIFCPLQQKLSDVFDIEYPGQFFIKL